jgi:UDP-glucose 4-epimerase
VILDNLVRGARAFTKNREFYEGDIADGAVIDEIFRDHPDIYCVIHCAALAIVPESMANPLLYYRENVGKTVLLLEHLLRNGCTRFVFSSSAAIYETGPDFTVDESSAIKAHSPYANTKLITEEILRDTAEATALRALALRYFNPVGSDPLLRTGLQVPQPSSVMGKLIEALEGGSTFTITGVEWPTRDGSAIRDYIHVWDLAQAHLRAVERFDDIFRDGKRYDVVNLGTGSGTTVRELVAAFRAVVGDRLSAQDGPPRPGDVGGSYTRTEKAGRVLGWQAERSLEDAVRTSLAWWDLRHTVLD